MNKKNEEATIDKFPVLVKQAEKMDNEIGKFQVTNEDELKMVAEKTKQIKTLQKLIEKDKDDYVAPAKAIIAKAKEKYDPFIKRCENAVEVLKQRAKKYMVDRNAKIALDEARIAARAEKGTIKQETAIKKMEELPEASKTVRSDTGSGLRLSNRKVAKIIEPNLIPDEYWEINEVRVRRDALDREKNGLPQIPGVIIETESDIASI
jgi:DNA modification methylase